MGYYVHEALQQGELFTSNNYGDYEVIKYVHSKEVHIRFRETGYTTKVTSGSIRSGMIFDPYKPRKYGNFMGDGPYNEFNTPIVCSRWKGIYKRAGTSGGIITASECWKDYQKFYDWSEKQVGHNLKEYQVDKDLLLPGNTHYSAENCCYLPGKINSLKFNRVIKEDGFPMGVSLCEITGKYRARWRDASGRQEEQRVTDYEDAIDLVAISKKSIITSVAEKYKNSIDPRAYIALINWDIRERMVAKGINSV